MLSKKDLLNELITLQLKSITPTKKFTYQDFKRIVKNLDTSIFNKRCCLWKGYVANNEPHKSPYINFYFREKKLALHRLLYCNFIGPLTDNEYIKYSCKNKGKCCTLAHLIKYDKDKEIENKEIEIENKEIENKQIENKEIENKQIELNLFENK